MKLLKILKNLCPGSFSLLCSLCTLCFTVLHLLLEVSQLLLSSDQVQVFTLFPRVLVAVAVDTGVRQLSDQTGVVQGEVGGASVSPLQGHLVLLQVLIRNWLLVGWGKIKTGTPPPMVEPIEHDINDGSSSNRRHLRRGGNSVTDMFGGISVQ